MTIPHIASTTLIVAYDISDNRKRRNLFNHLAGYGVPLQESLFYCQLTSTKQKQQLSRELKELPLDPNDRLHCFPIDPDQAVMFSPSPINILHWVAE